MSIKKTNKIVYLEDGISTSIMDLIS